MENTILLHGLTIHYILLYELNSVIFFKSDGLIANMVTFSKVYTQLQKLYF